MPVDLLRGRKTILHISPQIAENGEKRKVLIMSVNGGVMCFELWLNLLRLLKLGITGIQTRIYPGGTGMTRRTMHKLSTSELGRYLFVRFDASTYRYDYRVDLFHNGGQMKYSFVLMLISLSSLATTSNFQNNFWFQN